MTRTAQIESEIENHLARKRVGDEEFRVEITDQSRPTVTLRRESYADAMRAAKDELLGSGGDRAAIYWRNTKVSEGYLQSRRIGKRGQKFSVRFVGEKPRKPR